MAEGITVTDSGRQTEHAESGVSAKDRVSASHHQEQDMSIREEQRLLITKWAGFLRPCQKSVTEDGSPQQEEM